MTIATNMTITTNGMPEVTMAWRGLAEQRATRISELERQLESARRIAVHYQQLADALPGLIADRIRAIEVQPSPGDDSQDDDLRKLYNTGIKLAAGTARSFKAPEADDE